VRFFAHHCWPLIRARIPSATWQIVGKNPMPEVLQLANVPGVTVTGEVSDTRLYLATASVAIAPLRIGSGTRLKILEAFAMQKAVVSSSIGCEGLAVEAGQHLLVADQPEAFAEAVIALLQQPEKRRELGRAGRALVETAYSWEQCGKHLLQAIEEMELSLV
ncbi:MAG TPA: glycosyltransferase family 4 protein, partial [Ktedonobacteraceae bacterium]|nr:glycosyltransferase family 4 protein [Ktedonobacteraceae bacterium]